MTKLQSSLDVVIEMFGSLEEFKRSGSKEAFRKQLRDEFVRRSGAASLDEALATGHDVSGSPSAPDARDERAIAETHCQIAQAEETRRLI
jgi:hypothetical protein